MKVIIVKKKQVITHPIKLKNSKHLSKEENKIINSNFYLDAIRKRVERGRYLNIKQADLWEKTTGEKYNRIKKKCKIGKKKVTVLKDKDSVEFYETKEWKITRARILKRDNRTCQECGATTKLHVHHIKYRYVSNADKDLITLCKYCHADKHPVNRAMILKA